MPGALLGLLGTAAAPVIGSTAASLIAPIGGALLSAGNKSGAARGAAGVQAGAAQSGIALQEAQLAEQQRRFDITQQQLAPFREAGTQALGQQRALLGLAGANAQQTAFQGLELSPGQQFLRDRQEQTLLRNQAAIGGLGGGNVRTALQAQAAGFAQQDLQNQLARLSGLASAGQTATVQTGQLGQNLGAQGAVGATNIADLLGTQGQARAGGILGAGQAQAGLLGDLSQIFGQRQGFGTPQQFAPAIGTPLQGVNDPTQTLGGRSAFALEGLAL